jgi:hypothetical protein
MIKLLEIVKERHGPYGGTFELSLTDNRTKAKVWTGTMDITGHLDSKLVINSAVKYIMNKLSADGITD